MIDIPATHTIFFLTNNLPNASVHEYAFWQRVHVIPFKVSFVDYPQEKFERKSDHELLDKLKEEAPGILAWLIKGYRKWYEKGLLKPDEVVNAVNEYFECKDHIGRFIKNCCKGKTGAKVKASTLYDAYEKWCIGEFIEPPTQTFFGKDMKKRKFEKKASNGIYYLGIKLKKSI